MAALPSTAAKNDRIAATSVGASFIVKDELLFGQSMNWRGWAPEKYQKWNL
jgi:hypothetical protein